MTGRALLEELDRALDVGRRVRYQPDADFDELELDEIDRVGRGLRALSYSCAEGARKMERIHRARVEVAT